MTKVTLEQDKVCKNSVRYSAPKSERTRLKLNQPFSVYIPNSMLPKEPPSRVEITLEFS